MKVLRNLIIGGGLAGCWLGYELLQRGHRVVLASRSLPGESSPVAAGLFHPAPGKRWNLRDGFAEEYPEAKKAYQELEALGAQSLWQEQLLARDLSYEPNAQRWKQLRCLLQEGHEAELSPWIERVAEQEGLVFFHSSGRMDVPATLRYLRGFIGQHSRGECWDTLIEDAEFVFEPEQIKLRGQLFDRVILCRGWREARGLGGEHLAWRNAAGEILELEFEKPLPAWIHSAANWRIPLASSGASSEASSSGFGSGVSHRALVGATHRWHEFSSAPQASAVGQILQALQQQKLKADVRSAQAGVRPIQQARQVLWERVRAHPRLWVLNSLGSHGALRAPVYAKKLACKLEQ